MIDVTYDLDKRTYMIKNMKWGMGNKIYKIWDKTRDTTQLVYDTKNKLQIV